ncbi:MAG: hypothetical protein LBS19_02590 [Clostridiales bacterium]|jgi:hypothetical protein|nr:hypothetical protein [Clostridiales bacterium]
MPGQYKARKAFKGYREIPAPQVPVAPQEGAEQWVSKGYKARLVSKYCRGSQACRARQGRKVFRERPAPQARKAFQGRLVCRAYPAPAGVARLTRP